MPEKLAIEPRRTTALPSFEGFSSRWKKASLAAATAESQVLSLT